MATFMSGARSTKFDSVEANKTTLLSVKAEINQRIDNIATDADVKLQTAIDETKSEISIIDTQIHTTEFTLKSTIIVLEKILLSKFMRFLNFFGKWYTIKKVDGANHVMITVQIGTELSQTDLTSYILSNN